jgi:hypothetical protein
MSGRLPPGSCRTLDWPTSARSGACAVGGRKTGSSANRGAGRRYARRGAPLSSARSAMSSPAWSNSGAHDAARICLPCLTMAGMPGSAGKCSRCLVPADGRRQLSCIRNARSGVVTSCASVEPCRKRRGHRTRHAPVTQPRTCGCRHQRAPGPRANGPPPTRRKCRGSPRARFSVPHPRSMPTLLQSPCGVPHMTLSRDVPPAPRTTPVRYSRSPSPNGLGTNRSAVRPARFK